MAGEADGKAGGGKKKFGITFGPLSGAEVGVGIGVGAVKPAMLPKVSPPPPPPPPAAPSALAVKYAPNRIIPVKGQPLPPPDYTQQNAAYEKDEPKLHLCNGVFEAYSAAYLTTRQVVWRIL
jgi:hypothetical protein